MTSIALPYLAVATVRGADAAAFLQAQLSADIEALSPLAATFACYCSPRGQVYGLLLVAREEDAYCLVAASELLPAIVQRLRLFVLRAQVEITQESGLHLLGEADAAAPRAPGSVQPMPGGPVYRIVAGTPETGAASAEGWRGQELARGIAWLGTATTERYIPQMLGFDELGAVSFRKGCYPGQEIIARARYLGQVKRRPLRLRVSATIEAGAGDTAAVKQGSEWVEATVIDSARVRETKETIVLLLARQPEGPVEQLRYSDRDYRCATM